MAAQGNFISDCEPAQIEHRVLNESSVARRACAGLFDKCCLGKVVLSCDVLHDRCGQRPFQQTYCCWIAGEGLGAESVDLFEDMAAVFGLPWVLSNAIQVAPP